MPLATRTAPFTGSFPVVEDGASLPHPLSIAGFSDAAGLPKIVSPIDPLPVSLRDLIRGELQQFNRLAGGAIVQRSGEVTADGVVHTGPCVFYGLKVIAAGTSVIVYDNTAASGTRVINAEATTTAGVVLTPAGPGVGVLMQNGIYLDLTGGTYVLYFVPQV
jgi:hypothetical protein